MFEPWFVESRDIARGSAIYFKGVFWGFYRLIPRTNMKYCQIKNWLIPSIASMIVQPAPKSSIQICLPNLTYYVLSITQKTPSFKNIYLHMTSISKHPSCIIRVVDTLKVLPCHTTNWLPFVKCIWRHPWNGHSSTSSLTYLRSPWSHPSNNNNNKMRVGAENNTA